MIKAVADGRSVFPGTTRRAPSAGRWANPAARRPRVRRTGSLPSGPVSVPSPRSATLPTAPALYKFRGPRDRLEHGWPVRRRCADACGLETRTEPGALSGSLARAGRRLCTLPHAGVSRSGDRVDRPCGWDGGTPCPAIMFAEASDLAPCTARIEPRTPSEGWMGTGRCGEFGCVQCFRLTAAISRAGPCGNQMGAVLVGLGKAALPGSRLRAGRCDMIPASLCAEDRAGRFQSAVRGRKGADDGPSPLGTVRAWAGRGFVRPFPRGLGWREKVPVRGPVFRI